MKKVLSLLILISTLSMMLFGCSSSEGDKGAAIPVYISTEIKSFDPAIAYTDEASMKVLSLIYEGLTYVNDKGKVKNALASNWKYTENADRGEYVLEVTLKETYWSDKTQVTADDFVFEWKRILEPEFRCEAAAMLMDIKNAARVKVGECSIDDLGLYAVDKTCLRIQFERPIDLDLFKEYCASPMLYPVREDAVNKADDWSTNTQIVVCNGPFVARSFVPGYSMILERNAYYYRDPDKDKITKSVTPYRLMTNYTYTPEQIMEKFENGEILYVNEIALSLRNQYKDDKRLVKHDTLNTHTYYFNTTRAPLNDVNVRQALSLALDRQAIADIVVFAKAATGFVPSGMDVTLKKDFRKEGGDLWSTSADMEKAKSLAASATKKNFTLSIRDNEVDRAVAEYCVEQWKQLGFTVNIRVLGLSWYEQRDYEVYKNQFNEALDQGDFDVIAIDWQAASTDSFSMLAPFAPDFSGSALDLLQAAETQNYSTVPHISGYNNAEYNQLIANAYASKRSDRLDSLHQAERLLAQDMPVMPLFVYEDAYMLQNDVKISGWFGEKSNYFGSRILTKMSFSKYDEFVTEAITLPSKEERQQTGHKTTGV